MGPHGRIRDEVGRRITDPGLIARIERTLQDRL